MSPTPMRSVRSTANAPNQSFRKISLSLVSMLARFGCVKNIALNTYTTERHEKKTNCKGKNRTIELPNVRESGVCRAAEFRFARNAASLISRPDHTMGSEPVSSVVHDLTTTTSTVEAPEQPDELVRFLFIRLASNGLSGHLLGENGLEMERTANFTFIYSSFALGRTASTCDAPMYHRSGVYGRPGYRDRA